MQRQCHAVRVGCAACLTHPDMQLGACPQQCVTAAHLQQFYGAPGLPGPQFHDVARIAAVLALIHDCVPHSLVFGLVAVAVGKLCLVALL